MTETRKAKRPVTGRFLKATEERLSQLDLGYMVGFHIAKGSSCLGSEGNLGIVTTEDIIDGYLAENPDLNGGHSRERNQLFRIFCELRNGISRIDPYILGQAHTHFWRYLMSNHYKKAPYEINGKVVDLKEGKVTLAHMVGTNGSNGSRYTAIAYPTIEEVIFYSAPKKQ